jgi:UDPglucose--hexose-1-phosphate uridylyltransferase
MPELRIDPIVGRRVYVAEDRAGRPNDYAERQSVPSPRASSCFFCAGMEKHTPDAVATVRDSQGRWLVRVVPNKYPAVTLDQAPEKAFGVHEVIIESPRHVLNVTELGIEQLATVLRAYRDRLRHWAGDDRFRHAIVFKNAGIDAGASMEHVHSQLVALPYLPTAIQAEIDAAEQFHAAKSRCIFCDLVKRETAEGARLVLQQNGYVALCAYAPRQPYETWLLPARHQSRYEDLSDQELNDQAVVLNQLLTRLENVSPGAAYNLLLHTAPFGQPQPCFHWHWELVPRLTHEAGLEWGAGVYITPLSPERAAGELRTAI